MRCATAVVVLAAMVLAPSIVAAQPCNAALSGGKKVESARYYLSYRTQPEKIAVGRHFAVELAICPKNGVAPPESLRVDAYMPEHRHGMNYKAEIAPSPGGRFRADGLMFHMLGRWELVFDVRSSGRTDRMTQSMVLE